MFIVTLISSSFTWNGKDTVKVVAEPKIIKLNQKYVALNQLKQSIAGYRVQIHFGNEREKAKEIKAKFMLKFQEIPAYDSYQSPNFRIRVGDFRTRLEALKCLKQVNILFPSSFIVNDNIKLPKLPIE